MNKKQKTENLPPIGSLWFDNAEGCGHLYKYKGIDNSDFSGGRMHFVRIDFETGIESEGGTWMGAKRFAIDMVTAEGAAKHPCCGHPAQYPVVWCDDCGYEKWSEARDTKEKGKAA